MLGSDLYFSGWNPNGRTKCGFVASNVVFAFKTLSFHVSTFLDFLICNWQVCLLFNWFSQWSLLEYPEIFVSFLPADYTTWKSSKYSWLFVILRNCCKWPESLKAIICRHFLRFLHLAMLGKFEIQHCKKIVNDW